MFDKSEDKAYSKGGIAELDLDALLRLRAHVDDCIEHQQERKRKEAVGKVRELAEECGLTAEELLRMAVPASGRKRPSKEPRYANPDDPTQTWSGLGRHPVWFREKLEAGVKPEDLLIARG